MATHDYIISNASGAAVRADLNNALAAIATNNSSATEPTTTYAYQWWADTGSSPTVMKLRNAANSGWVTLFQLDGEWSLIPFENGTAAAPSIYFKDSGTDTGLFSPGVDQVGITTGGAVRLTTSTTAFTGTLPWQGQNGTAAAPALSFSGDPNTGVYNVGADNIGVSTNGTLRFDVSTTAITSTLPAVYPLGAVGTPSVTFTGDLNTGIYSPGADSVAITTGGTARATVDSSGRLLVGTTTATNNIRLQESVALVATGTGSIGGFSTTTYGGTTTTASSALDFQRSRGTTDGSLTSVAAGDRLGIIAFRGADGAAFQDSAFIESYVEGTPAAGKIASRLVFSTTADAASSPTERMRISQAGFLSVGNITSFTDKHVIQHPSQTQGNQNLEISNSFKSFVSSGAYGNAAATNININSNTTTSRSLNANGTINASGTDYAEYMVKTGDFTIAKGAVCGVTSNGLLTLDYADAVSFAVKSTNPSYVGGDTWGNEDVLGPKPDAEDADALAQWEADLEAARQRVDRIAFAGQVPVNVMGATPGQYIVPVEAADGGIEGIAKNEADLTLAEYMRAVGKVIAIEDDGRARIIVKVA